MQGTQESLSIGVQAPTDTRGPRSLASVPPRSPHICELTGAPAAYTHCRSRLSAKVPPQGDPVGWGGGTDNSHSEDGELQGPLQSSKRTWVFHKHLPQNQGTMASNQDTEINLLRLAI